MTTGVFRICLTVIDDAGYSSSACREVSIGTTFRRGDGNASGTIDIADPIKLLGHLFARTGPLPAPFATCGIDVTEDVLGCVDLAPCP